MGFLVCATQNRSKRMNRKHSLSEFFSENIVSFVQFLQSRDALVLLKYSNWVSVVIVNVCRLQSGGHMMFNRLYFTL